MHGGLSWPFCDLVVRDTAKTLGDLINDNLATVGSLGLTTTGAGITDFTQRQFERTLLQLKDVLEKRTDLENSHRGK